MNHLEEEKILVVDDNVAIRDLIGKALGAHGIACRLAADGQNALELLKKERFSIIIFDIKIPGIDSLELLKIMKKDFPATSVVITGYDSGYSYEGIIEAGADDFIKKPFTIMEIQTRIQRILKERKLILENKRLIESYERTNNRLRRLLEVSLLLTTELNFDALFDLIIKNTSQMVEADRGSLYVVDRKKQEVWTKVAEGIEGIRLPIGVGIAGTVAQTGEVVYTEDAWSHPKFDKRWDIRNDYRTKTMLCLPVKNREQEIIGILQAINKVHGTFDQEDEGILKSLSSQIAVALENSWLLEEQKISFESFVKALGAAVDARHPYTAGHSQRVTDYSLMIATKMGLSQDEMEILKYVALLHDLGKIGISDSVLLKNGPFDPSEREEMRKHPLKTREILSNIHFPKPLKDVPEITSYHHEWLDGRGYPYGLKGDDLPLFARIIAVADVYDALTSKRDYPKYNQKNLLGFGPLSVAQAIKILDERSSTQFDPEVLKAFKECIYSA